MCHNSRGLGIQIDGFARILLQSCRAGKKLWDRFRESQISPCFIRFPFRIRPDKIESFIARVYCKKRQNASHGRTLVT